MGCSKCGYHEIGAFHVGGMFEKSLNASFISLIPKVLGAIDLKDFHLIFRVAVFPTH
jgi:hypothetical protein